MTKEAALKAFGLLEKCREPMENPEPDDQPVPTYKLRLEAASDQMDDYRTFRLRVSPGPWGEPSRDDWLYVLEVAGEIEADVRIDNGAIELR